ncbi:MAG: TIGR03619 family F420-dependent LLM class oxidoreductase [Chloroflexota bacterium]
MDYGLVLPTMHAGASVEGIEAAAEVADRVGWSDVWTTDHVLVDRDSTLEYGRIFEAILTLAHVGARHPRLRLGSSVIVVPQRQSVVLAKELASLDVLSRGRVIAGVGIGWNRTEFANLGVADRFAVRGAYLEETVGLWRHLWSGATTPFRGRFHDLEDFVFGPVPDQGADLPIWFGGRADVALRRAGRIGDGYHSSSTAPAKYAERIPLIRAAATEAGRPMPLLSARVRIQPEAPQGGRGSDYVLRGNPDQIRAGIAEWAAIGVTHMAFYFESVEPGAIVRDVEWFAREIAPAS